jgi:hypothetical protein
MPDKPPERREDTMTMTTETLLPLDLPEATPPHVLAEFVGRPRPRQSDPRVIEAAAKALAPAVVCWLGDDSDPDDIAADIAKAARYHSDGYELAKELERDGYDPDAELVDILGGLDTYRPHQAMLKQWVQANAIAPQFAAGDRVVCSRNGAGTVVEVQAETAQYVVRLDDPKSPNLGTGYIGTYCNFENVSAES